VLTYQTALLRKLFGLVTNRYCSASCTAIHSGFTLQCACGQTRRSSAAGYPYRWMGLSLVFLFFYSQFHSAAGTGLSGIASLLFAIIDPDASYWAFGFPSAILSVFGANFVYPSGTLFIATVSAQFEQSVGGAVFQLLTQVCGWLSTCALVLLNLICSVARQFSRCSRIDSSFQSSFAEGSRRSRPRSYWC